MMSELEYWLKRYKEKFHNEPPQINSNLSDISLCQLLRESVRWNENLNELDEISFLQRQYEAKFGERLGYNFMSINTEEELVAALRESLETGKPYELPDEVKRLIERGVQF